MNPKALFMVVLALASPFACTRIVKHYHYYFSNLELPTSNLDMSPCRLADDFLKRGGVSTTDEGYIFLKDILKIVIYITIHQSC